MKYIIERSVGGEGIKWVKSDSYPGAYSQSAAEAILDDCPQMNYRITPVEPYRRHAAASYLELRGATAMLHRAHDYIAKQVGDSSIDVSLMLKTFSILWDARLAVTRQMETL
jgi:hypothetical protein